MKTTTVAAMAGVALVISVVSLVITLIQPPAALVTDSVENLSAPITISGGVLWIGSAHPWSYDARSQRMRYEGRGVARHLKVVLDRQSGQHVEETLTREPATRLGIIVSFGRAPEVRTLLLESDREGKNLEITLSDREKRVDPAYLQILPHLLRDPSPLARITAVTIEGCHRDSGGAVLPYQVDEGGIALSLHYDP